MAAPTVRDLGQIMAELQPAYNQSRQLIQQQQAGLGAKYDAQKSGLYAQRGEDFNTINNQATSRGMSFSGIPLHEMARYSSTKFLPGLQQLDYQQNDENLKLTGQLANIDKELRLGAMNIRDKEVSTLNDWNKMMEQQRFQAQQAQLQRNFQASQAAAARAKEDERDPYGAALAYISKKVGGDGYVSPVDFQIARDLYRREGGDAHKFAQEFWKYTGASTGQKNQANINAYYYG